MNQFPCFTVNGQTAGQTEMMILQSFFSLYIMLKCFAYKPGPNKTTNSWLLRNFAYVKLLIRKITARWVTMFHQYFEIRSSQNRSQILSYLYRFIQDANTHETYIIRKRYFTELLISLWSFSFLVKTWKQRLILRITPDVLNFVIHDL